MQRIKEMYIKSLPDLKRDLGIRNIMAIPKVVKVVVNMGVGDAIKDKAVFEQAKKDLSAITGQNPSTRPAKVSVASFGVRRGMPVGLKVTLRGEHMYAFLDKLFSIVLPRLRDFRGVSINSFDKAGNYTLGIYEHAVFPEIDISQSRSRGLEITIVTNTRNIEYSRKLLELLGMPFEKG